MNLHWQHTSSAAVVPQDYLDSQHELLGPQRPLLSGRSASTPVNNQLETCILESLPPPPWWAGGGVALLNTNAHLTHLSCTLFFPAYVNIL